MRSIINKIIEFYVYSSLHIALCAAALILYSYSVFSLEPDYHYAGLVASCTMILYAVHRLVGLKRVTEYHNIGRFQIILAHRIHLYIYIVVAGAIAGYLALKLDRQKIMLLMLPSVLSLLYVLPVLKGKRLRDLAYIKIFIIAICWAWLCCLVPLYNQEGFFLFALGKCFFIFAITIPFDIRDRKVDIDTGVSTLATMYGLSTVKFMGVVACMISLILTAFFHPTFLLTESIVHLVAAYLIIRAHEENADYYYSLITDGTIALFYLVAIMIQNYI